jgi:hypothetical protein
MKGIRFFMRWMRYLLETDAFLRHEYGGPMVLSPLFTSAGWGSLGDNLPQHRIDI